MKYTPNLYDILEQLQRRKAMFLGNDYTFKCLESFITGFTLAAQSDQLEKPDCNNFTYFSTWLLGHLDKHFGLSGGWHWQIMNRNPHDDGKAFEEFFSFLEQFKRAELTVRAVVVDAAVLQFSIDGPVKRYSSIEMKDEHLMEKPHSIRRVTMSGSSTAWVEFLNREQQVIADDWYLSEEEAEQALRKEFGELEGKWVEEKNY